MSPEASARSAFKELKSFTEGVFSDMAAKRKADEADLGDPKESFIKAVKGMFETQEFSDLTIKCGHRQWKLHKNVVCCRSQLFKKACAGGFKEATEDTIVLEDDVPMVVNAMLRYLYAFDYDYDMVGVPKVVFDVHVHNIADKYDVPGLMILAEAKFARNAGKFWNTIFFADAIQEVYAAADQYGKLRKIVVDISVKHAKQLYSAEFGVHFRGVASTIASLSSEIATALATEPKKTDITLRYSCPFCSFITEEKLR